MDLLSAVRSGLRLLGKHRAPAAVCLMLLLVLLGAVAASAATVQFPDVQDSRSDYTAIVNMAKLGIISGYANGKFGPADAVTRAQVAKLIVNAARLLKIEKR